MLIDKREALRQIVPYAKSSTAIGVAFFIYDFGLYWAGIAGVLFLSATWMKVLAATVAGFKLSSLKTLGHDAAHGSLVRQRRLNWLLGVISYAPCIYNYRMWVYDHHVGHHPHTNGPRRDSFTPFTKAEFDALPKWRQWMERLYRGPNVVGWSVYYLIERWWYIKIFPRDDMPEQHRRAAWPHFYFLVVYVALFLGALVAAPLYSNTGPLEAILLGAVYPFLVFMGFTGWGLYLQHVHPDVAWLRGSDEDNKLFYGRGELLAVHWVMPRWFASLTHDVMDHPVHHLHPRIPCYRLRAAQAKLNELLGEHAIVEKYTLRSFLGALRACKLYDFENHRWLDFDGKPTTGTTRMFRLTAKELLTEQMKEQALRPYVDLLEAA
jgi:acyl-lipid omega-6 desaturase (Delta-12 desaturase)